MDERTDTYGWEMAFRVCGVPEYTRVSSTDVARVIAESDEPEWIGVFELRDGRFAFVAAGCDQSGGSGCVAGDLESLVRFGLDGNARFRLAAQLRAEGIEL